MSFKVDVAISSISKHREEVCGDTAVVIPMADSTTVILSDGLGSGIKASILSILTTRIAAGLLKRQVGLEQVFETIAATLPTCKVRQLAYSTLSILQVTHEGAAHLIEYDNPELLWLRRGRLMPIERRKRVIAGKNTLESFFTIEIGDLLLLMSDGVINAGVGGLFRLGVGYEGVISNLRERSLYSHPAEEITREIINLVEACYLCEPGDDATTAAIMARAPRQALVLTGPPRNPEDDQRLIRRLESFATGERIVCGGATGNLVARETRRPIMTSLKYEDPSVPPTAAIDGIDLVTEGILTLNKCLEKLNQSSQGVPLEEARDGATLLAQKLLHADEIIFLLGGAVNPAHNEFMHSLQLKTRPEVVNALSAVLRSMDKKVVIEAF